MLSKYEFHVAGHIRRVYNFAEELFSISGNVIFANFHQVRNFVHELNKSRTAENKLNPAQVNAAGLLDEIFHFVIKRYREEINPGAIDNALAYLNEKYGHDQINDLIFDFVTVFPPSDVYKNKISVSEYLDTKKDGKANRLVALEELILLHLSNFNSANLKLKELLDENYISNAELYKKVIVDLEIFFKTQPKFGPENQDLITLLKAPIISNPDDIEAQLLFIQEKWSILIDEEFLGKLLKSSDFIKENRQLTIGFGGPPPSVVPKYKSDEYGFGFTTVGKSGYDYGKESLADYEEIENFTKDIEWMPRVVLMAKNIHVWLDQLSKKYGRHIHRLDHVPDEELDMLVNWGFNGLWLIGLWERSSASKKIKHIMGNTDATASAYSLFDYEIAHDLGGEEAYTNLNERAKQRGLRLSSDMVPNHTGVFSRWVLENPHYFIQSDFSPFPNYTFTGTDLSDDARIQLRIEDGYWNKTDASVVFQRIDNNTGNVKYLYHGNDGTNMPWNDTAQLNLLDGEVREAVIQKIFDVARKFSIIRFDAAMTLTKKHFSRLWYPRPGTGGDIPSRVDHAMTKTEFDNQFPVEFWREVVDRINNELPETLLLAEAFWLMEGYFVRTLGMHRVYNSAFMHMMMREENEKYRDLITNTLEYEPEILKRYVNFMSNPDEETAIKQFGTEDKYIGVALMMITLPGLPMFAHGQVEGFTEKYGMEYQRAYYNETPKTWLIERHEREIFPLMKKRYLFSDVVNFWLFDFLDSFGSINENVFAFVNTHGHEGALIFYNNKYERAAGHIKMSAPKLILDGDGNKSTTKKSLADALNLSNDSNIFYSVREHLSGKEFLLNGSEIHNQGIGLELNGFQSRVYINFRMLDEDVTLLYKVREKLPFEGVDDLNSFVKFVKYESIYNSFTQLLTLGYESFKLIEEETKVSDLITMTGSIVNEYNEFINVLEADAGLGVEKQDEKIRLSISTLSCFFKWLNSRNVAGLEIIKLMKRNSVEIIKTQFVFSILNDLKTELKGDFNKLFSEVYLTIPINKYFLKMGKGDLYLRKREAIISTFIKYSDEFLTLVQIKSKETDKNKLWGYTTKLMLQLLKEKEIQSYLAVNEYQEVLYYSREGFEQLLYEVFSYLLINIFIDESEQCADLEKLSVENIIPEQIRSAAIFYDDVFDKMKVLSGKSEYRFEELINILDEVIE
ncbi:MAG: alpha-amylase [Bacteroidetes bacterium]|nr:alpha-amylase [Bacteroidota bacterium]